MKWSSRILILCVALLGIPWSALALRAEQPGLFYRHGQGVSESSLEIVNDTADTLTYEVRMIPLLYEQEWPWWDVVSLDYDLVVLKPGEQVVLPVQWHEELMHRQGVNLFGLWFMGVEEQGYTPRGRVFPVLISVGTALPMPMEWSNHPLSKEEVWVELGYSIGQWLLGQVFPHFS